MRRVRLGWCARRTGAEILEDPEIRRTDEELDRLGARQPVASDDPTLRLLGSLASDVDEDVPPRQPPPKRRLLSRAALTTGLTIVALSGTGAATATVMVGGVSSLQPIHHAVEALYERNEQPGDLRGAGGATASETEDSPDVSTSEVRDALAHARQALDAGRLDEGRRWLQEARTRWSQLGAPTGGLAQTLSALEDRLETLQARAGEQGEQREQGEQDGQGEAGPAAASAERGTTAEAVSPSPTPTSGGDGGGVTPSPTPGDSSTPSPSPTGSPDGGRSDDTGDTGGGSDGGDDKDDGTDKPGGQTGGGRADDTSDPGESTGDSRSEGPRGSDRNPGHSPASGHSPANGHSSASDSGPPGTGRPDRHQDSEQGRWNDSPGSPHERSEHPPDHRDEHDDAFTGGSGRSYDHHSRREDSRAERGEADDGRSGNSWSEESWGE